MGLFSRLLGGKSNTENKKPAIYGGDSLTEFSPAIINCASMGVAQILMERVINSHCRQGWIREIGFTLKDPSDPQKSLKMISVVVQDGCKQNFYSDLSRPVKNAMKLQGMISK